MEMMEQTVVEQPIESEQPEERQPIESSDSVADHAAKFGPEAKHDPTSEAQPAEELKPIRPVDQQRREQGKFAEGKQRLKAKDAVERINQLTGRAKTAEERFAAAEQRVAALESELAQMRREGAPRAEIKQAEQRVEQAQATEDRARVQVDPSDPPPDKGKYDDYEAYLDDRAAWRARQEFKTQQRELARRAQQQQQDRTWYERVESAKKELPDFENVAFAPVAWADQRGQIRPGCEAIDAFITEDDSGAKVLYHLQAHPDQTSELMRMSPLQQMKWLSLLSQRLSSPTPSRSAGTTGSATGRQMISLPPTPPNPVRTEAQRAGDPTPPRDGSLSIAEHSKHFGRTLRQRK